MTSFHTRTNRRHIFLSNIINQRRWCRQIPLQCKAKLQRSRHYLSAPHILRLLPYFPPQPQSVSTSPPQKNTLAPSLNSLWTLNANSVRHSIRHIHSISPLIVLIPLCNTFPRCVRVAWRNSKGKTNRTKGIAARGL